MKINENRKYVPTIEQFINESKINEAESFELKDDSNSGRPTLVLNLKSDAWEKVKHLFDTEGRPNEAGIKSIKSQGTVWGLYAAKYPKAGEVIHRIYGVSGDYTFGLAPRFYRQQYSGNKKAAKEVLNYFIDKYLK